MPLQKLNIQPLLDQAKAAREEYGRSGSFNALFRMITLYSEVNKVLMDEATQKAQKPALPMDPLINTAGRYAHRAAGNLNGFRGQMSRGEGDPPPGLLGKIQIATQAYQAWFTCLKSCADSKGQVQGELARFR